MATRSRIGIKTIDGTIHSVYCHWDGYLSNNGKILLRSYNTEDVINDLIHRGDMSFLDDSVEFCKRYEHEGNRPIAHKNEEEYINEGEEFNYLFKDGKWYYENGEREFKELNDSYTID
jgi:hypothetical protein